MEDPENVDYLAVELMYEVLVLPVAISVDTGLTWLALSAFWACFKRLLIYISRGSDGCSRIWESVGFYPPLPAANNAPCFK